MKQILINSALLTISIITFFWYKRLSKKRYGLRSSISASAKDFTQDGDQIYSHIFIIFGLYCTLSFIAQSYITTISAALLSTIGIITGYNINLKKSKLQDTLHIIFTFIGIIGFMTGIIFINYWYSIAIFILLIGILYLYFKKVHHHTRKIEDLIVYTAWLCLGIQFILLPLIKYFKS